METKPRIWVPFGIAVLNRNPTAMTGREDMMKTRIFASPPALVALVALMGLAPVPGGIALAQEGRDTDAALPLALQSLNLSDLRVEEGERGHRRIAGALEDGTSVEAFVTAGGNFLGLRARDGGLSDAALAALLPQPVRDNPILDQFDTVEGLRLTRGGVEIGGRDAEGMRLRAAFDEAGRVMRFGRDDKRGRPEMRRNGGSGRAAADGRGKPGHGPIRDIDADALTRELEAAGYADLGPLRDNGWGKAIDATNPQGEAVTLEIAPRGEVLREIAR